VPEQAVHRFGHHGASNPVVQARRLALNHVPRMKAFIRSKKGFPIIEVTQLIPPPSHSEQARQVVLKIISLAEKQAVTPDP